MDFLISAGIGGLIGYFTNWLAIRMLFRPYEEKKILGLKVPFTPGLIPKEQKRMAKSIGITVEEYLLSPESIIKFIDEDKVSLKIIEEIDLYLSKIEEKNYRLEDLFILFGGRDYKVNIIYWFSKILEDESIKKQVQKVVLENFKGHEFIVDILGSVEKFLKEKPNRDKIIGWLKDIISQKEGELLKDERRVEDLFPFELREGLLDLLDENKNLIMYRISTFIKKDEIEYKIKKSISNMVEKNITGFIASLLPMDMVSEKIYKSMENYLDSREGIEDMNNLLKTATNNIFDKRVKDLLEEITFSTDSFKIKDEIFSSLDKKLGEEDLLINLYKDGIRLSEGDLFEEIFKNGLESILNSGRLEALALEGISNSINKISQFKLTYIIGRLGINSENIFANLNRLFKSRVKDRLPDIIRSLKIGRIVESTILEFEFDFVEKLILDIAEKELRAITLLGGLLGCIIGLINPILQLI